MSTNTGHCQTSGYVKDYKLLCKYFRLQQDHLEVLTTWCGTNEMGFDESNCPMLRISNSFDFNIRDKIIFDTTQKSLKIMFANNLK